MTNEEEKLEAKDLFLLIFVLIAGWLILFQSNLF
jgi:hypothetical protein